MFMYNNIEPIAGGKERKNINDLINIILLDTASTCDLIQGGRIKKFLGCIRTPGVHAVIVFRFGQWLLSQTKPLRVILDPLYLIMNLFVQIMWGIELPRSTKIGAGFYIGHFGGITIHPETVIGRCCYLSQNTTIGISGKGIKRGVPVIGDNVFIAPGARIFGRISIGNNVKIGANAVIHKDIPNNSIVVSAPGFKIISNKGG